MTYQYSTCILASQKNGTIYIGVTNNLTRRISEHKNKMISGFTKDHDVNILVYYEIFSDIRNAIIREKQLKRWKRSWKIKLIEESTPKWIDLSES
jgi:putative endonuclease